MSDQLGYFRLKRLSRLAEKTRAIVGPEGQLSPVVLRTLIPLLDTRSIEEDDDMQDRWAALLANAGTRPDAVLPGFVEILRTLSPEEARLLEEVADGKLSIDDPAPGEQERTPGTIFIQMDVPWLMDLEFADPNSPEGRIVAALDSRHPRLRMWLTNLGRMGLATCRPQGDSEPISGVTWGLTTLGHCFVETCRAPRPAAG